MMAYKAETRHVPIWRDAQRLLVWAEEAVRRFSRYHKYTVGSQLREQALTVCRLIIRAQGMAADQRLGVVWMARSKTRHLPGFRPLPGIQAAWACGLGAVQPREAT